MTESNGRMKINPFLAWTIGTYLLTLGAGVGALLAQVHDISRHLDTLEVRVLTNTRSRSEGDEIFRRIDSELTELRRRVGSLEK